MHFTIIGAGMAGLLAAGMLRTSVNAVLEGQSALPHNHSAVLRFRSSIVGDTLNIPFTPVRMVKAIHGSLGNPVADALCYSIKTSGKAEFRSILSAKGEVDTRWIAPPDFIPRMAELVGSIQPIQFGRVLTRDSLRDLEPPIIWTGPMPVLMRILEYPEPGIGFRSIPGSTVRVVLEGVNAYVSLYYPSLAVRPYRATITGDELIIEYAWPSGAQHLTEDRPSMIAEVDWVMETLGLGNVPVIGAPVVNAVKYTKILPIPERARKAFILHATEQFGIYSLGRFATWRPGLLLDDLIQDMRIIQNIAAGGLYDHKKG